MTDLAGTLVFRFAQARAWLKLLQIALDCPAVLDHLLSAASRSSSATFNPPNLTSKCLKRSFERTLAVSCRLLSLAALDMSAKQVVSSTLTAMPYSEKQLYAASTTALDERVVA